MPHCPASGDWLATAIRKHVQWQYKLLPFSSSSLKARSRALFSHFCKRMPGLPVHGWVISKRDEVFLGEESVHPAYFNQPQESQALITESLVSHGSCLAHCSGTGSQPPHGHLQVPSRRCCPGQIWSGYCRYHPFSQAIPGPRVRNPYSRLFSCPQSSWEGSRDE